MGGRQKRLTKTRRAVLGKELTQALVEGKFSLAPGQSLDDLLDSIDDGIKNDVYPIEVTLDGLMTAWFSGPALTEPAEAQTAAPVAETAQMGAATTPAPYEITGQTGVTADVLPGPGVHANLEAAAAALAAGGTQEEILRAAMPAQAVDPNTPAEIDITAVEPWYQLLKASKDKLAEIQAMQDRAKQEISNLLDQEGGPDRSKVAMLHGRAVLRRTWVPRTTFKKDKLLADHPEYAGQYEETSYHYRVEVL